MQKQRAHLAVASGVIARVQHERTARTKAVQHEPAPTASVASAQSSITLYGRVDGAVYHQPRSSPSASQWTVSSDTSYFGLRGQEDLGNGLSSTFKLESQLDVSTGMSNATAFFQPRVLCRIGP